MKTIGERLARLRKYSGLSQRALCKRAGLSDHHVGRIENNDYKSLSSETALKLSSALGCSPEWLLYGLGEKPRRDAVRAHVDGRNGAPARGQQ